MVGGIQFQQSQATVINNEMNQEENQQADDAGKDPSAPQDLEADRDAADEPVGNDHSMLVEDNIAGSEHQTPIANN